MTSQPPSQPWTASRAPRCLLAFVLGLWVGACGGTAQARSGEHDPALERARAEALAADPVLRAMSAELDRSRTELALEDYERPYYLAYVIKDRRERTISGKLGAIHEVDDDHERYGGAEVRVGSWELDSSEDEEELWPFDDGFEPDMAMPLADDDPGIRHALWLLTDVAYKQALASYLEVRGQRVFEAERKRKRPSHSPATTLVQLDPPLELVLDIDRWSATVKRLGAKVGEREAVFDSAVSVAGSVVTRWMVTTEGTLLRTRTPMYELHVSAWTRSEDGMLLDKGLDLYGRSEADLPALPEFEVRVAAMLDDLVALRAAPELEPYTGPAILEPPATGVFFHEVLGHRLEGHRQDDEEEGQTFTDHLGQSIMPSFLSVLDDPTRTHHGSLPLNGHYRFDDQAVAAERVVLVDRGVLEGFLMGRRPVSGFERSNGHGRAQGLYDPVPRMGTLVVEAHRAVPRQRLQELLLEEVRKQSKPYGLVVRDITGGSTNTSSYGYQAFKGEARMVYRVDATTGEETLVRGVDIVGTPLTSLSKILAASAEPGVFNGYCGAESGMVPVSTIAPATLFREIELQRSARGRAKPPILSAPPSPLRPVETPR